MKSGIIVTVIILFISASASQGAFEGVDLGARPLGMGSAFAPVADGASAIFWNPAGLARIDGREMTMSYMELYSLVNYSSLGYTQRIKTWPLGFGLVSSSDVEGVYREITLVVSAARDIYDNVNLGGSVKYLSSAANTGDIKIGGGSGLALDVGCQYYVWKDVLCLGIAFQNLVGSVSYDRKPVKEIPGEKYWQRPGFSYKIGTSMDLELLSTRIDNAILVAEIADGDIHVGTEYVFWDIAAVRAGLRTGNALTRSVTAGLGLELSALRFDYAYIGSAIGAATSQISVSVNW